MKHRGSPDMPRVRVLLQDRWPTETRPMEEESPEGLVYIYVYSIICIYIYTLYKYYVP